MRHSQGVSSGDGAHDQHGAAETLRCCPLVPAQVPSPLRGLTQPCVVWPLTLLLPLRPRFSLLQLQPQSVSVAFCLFSFGFGLLNRLHWHLWALGDIPRAPESPTLFPLSFPLHLAHSSSFETHLLEL